MVLNIYLAEADSYFILSDDWETCMPINIFGKRLEDIPESDYALSERVKEFYFGDVPVKDISMEKNFRNFTEMFTDAGFANPIRLLIEWVDSKT